MLSSELMKNGLLWILNDLDSAGRGGGRRDEEEGGTRRKEGQGEEGGTGRGRREEESEKMKKLLKNGKSPKDALLASLGLV